MVGNHLIKFGGANADIARRFVAFRAEDRRSNPDSMSFCHFFFGRLDGACPNVPAAAHLTARGFLRVHWNSGLDDFLQGMENQK
jgi:hypothetical protein